MTILHVSTPKSWRGGEQQIAYLCLELRKAGVNQVVVCRKKSRMEAFCQREGIAFRALAKRSSLDLGFAYQLAKIARQEEASIVHPHDSHAHSFTVMAARFFGLQAAIVLHRRVDYPVKNSKASRFKYNYPQIKRIICVSKEVKRILDQSLRDPSKSIVIHSGVDLQKFNLTSNRLREEFNIDPSLVLIGNVAAITQQKDYFTFVNTAKLILDQSQQVHFFIIGDGDQKEEIMALVEHKKLADHFTFTGFRQDIAELLPSLDILLFPSEKEGLGTTVIDAFAAGVPVVAAAAGGIPELITPGLNGLLGGVKKPQELANHCLELIQQPDRRHELAQAARDTARHFSKENMARQVLAVYHEVAG